VKRNRGTESFEMKGVEAAEKGDLLTAECLLADAVQIAKLDLQ